MHPLGLTNLTAGLTGTPSHYPHQASTHPSHIDTCYGDPTTVRVHEATYGDLLPAGTGHQPLYIDLIIPILPPPAATLPDDALPRTLRLPAEDDHGAWHRYNRALHAILRRCDAPTLNTAMRWAAQACGMERNTSHTGHHRTSHSNSLSVTSGPGKRNSPPCCATAHQRHGTETPTSARSAPPGATGSRNGTPTA